MKQVVGRSTAKCHGAPYTVGGEVDIQWLDQWTPFRHCSNFLLDVHSFERFPLESHSLLKNCPPAMFHYVSKISW